MRQQARHVARGDVVVDGDLDEARAQRPERGRRDGEHERAGDVAAVRPQDAAEAAGEAAVGLPRGGLCEAGVLESGASGTGGRGGGARRADGVGRQLDGLVGRGEDLAGLVDERLDVAVAGREVGQQQATRAGLSGDAGGLAGRRVGDLDRPRGEGVAEGRLVDEQVRAARQRDAAGARAACRARRRRSRPAAAARRGRPARRACRRRARRSRRA